MEIVFLVKIMQFVWSMLYLGILVNVNHVKKAIPIKKTMDNVVQSKIAHNVK